MEVQIIGYAQTCYKKKFGIPRQSGLVPASYGKILLSAPYNQADALRGLDSFTHLIITFIAHQAPFTGSLTVRPPRLGGNKRLGVFATRSPYRPNSICSSIVKIENIDFENATIDFSNHDLLDGTPIIDLKPYIPQWDCIQEAQDGWIADNKETKLEVKFTIDLDISTQQKNLISEILSLNPTPRYHDETEKIYRMEIENLDVEFIFEQKTILVTKIMMLF